MGLRIDHPPKQTNPACQVFQARKAVSGKDPTELVSISKSHRPSEEICSPNEAARLDKHLYDSNAGRRHTRDHALDHFGEWLHDELL